MSMHWSQLPSKLIERLDRVRIREVKKRGTVLSYEPGRFVVIERGGQKITYRLNDEGRVRVIK